MIYYFSGSGNSLHIARKLAAEINSGVLPVKVIQDGVDPEIEYELIGFVFPVYDFKAPVFVEECVRKMKINNDAYIFCVATFGLSAGNTLNAFKSVIEQKQLRMNAGFTVAMPHNGVSSALAPVRIRTDRLKKNSESIYVIAQKINSRFDFIESNRPIISESIKSGIINMLPGLVKFLVLTALQGIDTLSYEADDNCIGCGTCSRICPADNISMVSGRPEWGKRCAGCFACLHWCPEEAISPGGHDMKILHYHHPEINIKDMSI